MKKFFRSIHLYLSLAAGLVIMMSCVTGAILVFEHEWEETLDADRYFVPAEAKRLPIGQLVSAARKAAPEGKLATVKVYGDPTRTVEIGMITPEKKEGGAGNKEKAAAAAAPKKEAKGAGGPDAGKKKPKGGKPSLIAFVNPYSGAVVEVFNRRESFFFQVEMLHRFLLTGNEGFGRTIVGVCTIFFLFILLTGLILWWPKTKKILQQRLKYKLNAGWKRLTHDLHLVTGFYTSVFLIIIVMTGLVMAFNWVNAGLFTLTGSKMENPEPPQSVYQAQTKPVGLDQVYQKVAATAKNGKFYNIRVPNDSVGVFAVNVLPENVVETAQDVYFLDQYTGQVAGTQLAAARSTGQKIRSYMKPVHTGAVFGLPTKILSFIIALLTFTFPITGVIMWLNRLKKSRKKGQRPLVAQKA